MAAHVCAPVIEIRTYRLRAGRSSDFDRLFTEAVVPMLTRHGIDVVACGRSLLDDDHYFLMRRYPSLVMLDEQEERFYGSAEWRDTLRETVMACIESYHTVVLPATSAAARHLIESADAARSDFRQ